MVRTSLTQRKHPTSSSCSSYWTDGPDNLETQLGLKETMDLAIIKCKQSENYCLKKSWKMKWNKTTETNCLLSYCWRMLHDHAVWMIKLLKRKSNLLKLLQNSYRIQSECCIEFTKKHVILIYHHYHWVIKEAYRYIYM